jgi:hypothetical protein
MPILTFDSVSFTICSQMSEPVTPSITTVDDAAESHAARAQGVIERQIARLEMLADAGVQMGLAIKEQATDPATREADARAFDRVFRAVRLAGLLQVRLLADLQRIRSWAEMQSVSARAAEEAEAADQAARLDPAYGHKARVEAVVARVARAETDDEDKIERVIAECGERLDDADVYGDVLTRPVGELVALICRDLKMEPDWPRLAQEAWALEEIASKAPGSPFAPVPLEGGGETMRWKRDADRGRGRGRTGWRPDSRYFDRSS